MEVMGPCFGWNDSGDAVNPLVIVGASSIIVSGKRPPANDLFDRERI
jgi:hypothetical protein